MNSGAVKQAEGRVIAARRKVFVYFFQKFLTFMTRFAV